jgi:hypothetical protein
MFGLGLPELFLAVILMAIVGFLALIVTRGAAMLNAASRRASLGMKACPFCAERIQAAAIVCRFCNRDLPTTVAAPPN